MKLDLIMNWLASNQEIVVWVATISFIAFIASLLMMPWVLVRLPADYFLVNDSASLVTRRSIKQLLVFALKKHCWSTPFGAWDFDVVFTGPGVTRHINRAGPHESAW